MKRAGKKRFVIVAQGRGKAMTYDGAKFSERTPRYFGTFASARDVGNGLIAKFPILAKYRVSVKDVTAAKRGPRILNPSIRDPELQTAAKLLEEFSGHKPTEVLRISEKPMRKGLVIGTLDGVLYTTVRDGKTEAYIHKFRKSSRPLLTARADGQQLGIVGGRFQMTEAGIEDR